MSVLIKKITTRWSESGIIEKADEDIYEYGLDLLIYTILNIAVILVSAIVIGKLMDSLALLAIILPLQSFGGGYHAKTHLRCFLIMYIGWWAVILILPLITLTFSVITSCAAVLVIFNLAPVPHENVGMSVQQRKKMRLLSRLTITICALSSVLFTLCISERVGIAMSMGLGVVSLSMLIACGKNIYKRKQI